MPAPYTIDDYLNLVISQHSDKPRFMAMLRAVILPGVQLQSVFLQLQTLFDLDTATGVQLDHVGEWLNQGRQVRAPITGVYFSVDDPTLGVDQGIIFTPYSPVNGLTELDDDHYRLLLRGKVAANVWNGTYADDPNGGLGIVSILQIITQPPLIDPSQTFVFYQGNTAHEAVIGISGKLPSPLAQALLTEGYIYLAPMGISMQYAITSIDGLPMFGVDMDNEYVAGLDEAAIAILS